MVGDFVVVDEPTLDQFHEFRSSHTTQGVCDLRLSPLLVYYITRVVKIPLNVTHKFGHSYLAMDMCDIDRLVEWVDTMRGKVTTAGRAAFEL